MEIAQSCPTLCNPMDYTVHGILQARIPEWGAVSFSRGSSQPRDWTQGLSHCKWILYHLSQQGSPRISEWVIYPFSNGSSQPRNRTRVSCTAGRFFTNWGIMGEKTVAFQASAKTPKGLYVKSVLNPTLFFLPNSLPLVFKAKQVSPFTLIF